MIYTVAPTTFGTRAAVAAMLTLLSPSAPPSVAIERSERAHTTAPGTFARARTATWNFDAFVFGEPPTAAPPILTGQADIVTLDTERETTAREQTIGEIRSWTSLSANWDGEGAAAPNVDSLKEAWIFVALMKPEALLPDPMLLASGRAGLYWNDGALYADLEFTGDGWVTYYIEQRGKGKHKGGIIFDGKSLPAVFSALLPI